MAADGQMAFLGIRPPASTDCRVPTRKGHFTAKSTMEEGGDAEVGNEALDRGRREREREKSGNMLVGNWGCGAAPHSAQETISCEGGVREDINGSKNLQRQQIQ